VPRQPLNKIVQNLKDPIGLGLGTFAARPELAALVCDVITGWARVEGSLSLVFARYTYSRVDIAMSTYNSVEGYRAQRQMLGGAARAALSVDNYMLFEATMEFVKRQYNIRNEMAHWIWGKTEDLPDALIIMEPVSQRKTSTMIFGARNVTDLINSQKFKEDSGKKTFVYRKNDLETHAKEMFKAEVLADRLQYLVAKPPQDHDEGRQHLLQEPDILRDYEKLKAKADKTTASEEKE
jgi:hypothetical protein